MPLVAPIVSLLIKVRSDVLIRDGVLDEDLARQCRLSEHDVLEDPRLHGCVDNVGDVALAVFERNGHIAVVAKRT